MKKFLCLIAAALLSSSCVNNAIQEKTEPQSASDYIKRGVENYDKGNSDAAVADFNTAIKLDPSISTAYVNKAIISIEKDNLKDAMDDLNNAIKADPQNDIAYYNRAVCNDALGDYAKAAEDFTRVLEISGGKHAVDFSNRAVAYSKQNLYDIALEDFSKAIEIDPSIYDAYFNRGCLYLDVGDFPKAVSDFTKAIDIKPDSIEAYENRGISYYMQGFHGEALKDFNSIIMLSPEHPDSYLYKGEILSDMKNYPDAAENFKKAIALSCSEPLSAYENLLELLIITNRKDEFIKTLKVFESDFPDSSLAGTDITIKRYFSCIAAKLENKNTSKEDKDFDEALKKEFPCDWETDSMLNYLARKENTLSPEEKKYILSVTEKLDDKINNSSTEESHDSSLLK